VRRVLLVDRPNSDQVTGGRLSSATATSISPGSRPRRRRQGLEVRFPADHLLGEVHRVGRRPAPNIGLSEIAVLRWWPRPGSGDSRSIIFTADRWSLDVKTTR
jgi:hypothetical protein